MLLAIGCGRRARRRPCSNPWPACSWPAFFASSAASSPPCRARPSPRARAQGPTAGHRGTEKGPRRGPIRGASSRPARAACPGRARGCSRASAEGLPSGPHAGPEHSRAEAEARWSRRTTPQNEGHAPMPAPTSLSALAIGRVSDIAERSRSATDASLVTSAAPPMAHAEHKHRPDDERHVVLRGRRRRLGVSTVVVRLR